MKYVANSKLGIGEVINITDKFMEVYFEEVDQTKKLLLDFAPKTFDTYQEAEAFLNPEMTEEIANKVITEIEADKKIMADCLSASMWMENHNIEASKKLMQNI